MHFDREPNPSRYYGWFQCLDCDHDWTSARAWQGRGQKCGLCMRNRRSVRFTKPYEVTLDDPDNTHYYSGSFECSYCGYQWTSDWNWQVRGQKCKRCTTEMGWDEVEYTNPYRFRPLLKPDPNQPRPRIPADHDYYNCEYCAELCGSITIMPTRYACKTESKIGTAKNVS